MLIDSFRDFQDARLSRIWGKYAGKVVGNSDSQQMGRLEVTCPAVLGSETVWALPCVPYAGPGVGFHFLPPVGAGVWIEFEGGDVSRAIWAGCYWAKGDLPADAESADVKLIVTDGATIKITDPDGEVVLENKQKASTTWGEEILVVAGDAKHSVGASGVTSESASGAGKVEVSDSGVSVNSDAFSVK